MKRWINGHKLRAVWTRAGIDAARSKAHPNSPIYVLEEEDLECVDPPETHEQRLMRVERCMLLLTSEWLALTGRAEPPVPEQTAALSDVRTAWQRWAKPRTWLRDENSPDLQFRDDVMLHAALERLFAETSP